MILASSEMTLLIFVFGGLLIAAILVKTVLGKLALLTGLCYLFSIFLEARMTDFLCRVDEPPEPMLVVAGVGFLVAALAGLLGFSVAIGAFLASLVFSLPGGIAKNGGI
jgi:Kef-type K+ transport system membrane component KefB